MLDDDEDADAGTVVDDLSVPLLLLVEENGPSAGEADVEPGV